MSKYYCLIAGLPEIRSEEYKLKYNLAEFKQVLKNDLDPKDFDLVTLFYRKFDNLNLLAYLKNPDTRFDSRGSLTPGDFAALIKQLNEQELRKDDRFPDYYREFIPAYKNDKPIFPGMSWEDQLTSLHYNAAIQCGNAFIAEWFEFNLSVTNILTAVNARNYSMDLSGAIVGTSELSDTLRSSNAKDFGITHIFSYPDEVMRIADENDLLDREKKTDLLKWSWIEEHVFHYHFSIENIFAYLLQTEILERWINLNHENGSKVFKDFIDLLRGSFLFPEEYILIK